MQLSLCVAKKHLASVQLDLKLADNCCPSDLRAGLHNVQVPAGRDDSLDVLWGPCRPLHSCRCCGNAAQHEGLKLLVCRKRVIREVCWYSLWHP